MKDGAKYNEHKKLASDSNVDKIYRYLRAMKRFPSQLNSSLKTFLLTCQRKVIKEMFKMVLLVFITISIIKTIKIRNFIYIALNFLWIFICVDVLIQNTYPVKN